MCNELAFAEIRACQLEDRSEDGFRVFVTVIVRQAAIVIDVGDEKRYRPTCASRLGNGRRGGIDERVVGGEPSVLIEKNEMLQQAGRSPGTGCRRAEGVRQP
jgi:hypothetical protein